MALFPRTASGPISKLRAAIASATRHDALHSLPESFAGLITAFEHLNVHPEYRNDVYALLASAVRIGNAVLDHTYPAKTAITEVTNLMSMLPRMIHHLTDRPTTKGLAIMVPGSGQIYPQIFNTEEEASRQLSALQKLGAASSAIIIPVQITSDHAIRPDSPPAPQAAWDPSQLPAGIRPGLSIPVSDFDGKIDPKDLEDRLAQMEGSEFPQMDHFEDHFDTTAPVETRQISPLAAENIQAPVPHGEAQTPSAPSVPPVATNPSEATP